MKERIKGMDISQGESVDEYTVYGIHINPNIRTTIVFNIL